MVLRQGNRCKGGGGGARGEDGTEKFFYIFKVGEWNGVKSVHTAFGEYTVCDGRRERKKKRPVLVRAWLWGGGERGSSVLGCCSTMPHLGSPKSNLVLFFGGQQIWCHRQQVPLSVPKCGRTRNTLAVFLQKKFLVWLLSSSSADRALVVKQLLAMAQQRHQTYSKMIPLLFFLL